MPELNRPASGPINQQEAVGVLLKRFTELSVSLNHIGGNVNRLAERLGRMAEMAGRVNVAMMMMVGLPRVFRSDLFHLMAYGPGGGRGSGGGHGRSPSFSRRSSGGGGMDDSWVRGAVAELRNEQFKKREEAKLANLEAVRQAVLGDIKTKTLAEVAAASPAADVVAPGVTAGVAQEKLEQAVPKQKALHELTTETANSLGKAADAAEKGDAAGTVEHISAAQDGLVELGEAARKFGETSSATTSKLVGLMERLTKMKSQLLPEPGLDAVADKGAMPKRAIGLRDMQGRLGSLFGSPPSPPPPPPPEEPPPAPARPKKPKPPPSPTMRSFEELAGYYKQMGGEDTDSISEAANATRYRLVPSPLPKARLVPVAKPKHSATELRAKLAKITSEFARKEKLYPGVSVHGAWELPGDDRANASILDKRIGLSYKHAAQNINKGVEGEAEVYGSLAHENQHFKDMGTTRAGRMNYNRDPVHFEKRAFKAGFLAQARYLARNRGHLKDKLRNLPFIRDWIANSRVRKMEARIQSHYGRIKKLPNARPIGEEAGDDRFLAPVSMMGEPFDTHHGRRTSRPNLARASRFLYSHLPSLSGVGGLLHRGVFGPGGILNPLPDPPDIQGPHMMGPWSPKLLAEQRLAAMKSVTGQEPSAKTAGEVSKRIHLFPEKQFAGLEKGQRMAMRKQALKSWQESGGWGGGVKGFLEGFSLGFEGVSRNARAYLKNTFSRVNQKTGLTKFETLLQSGQGMMPAFMGMAAGGMQLAQAASPDAYETVTKSFQLLAGTIGAELIPHIVTLSSYVQSAASGFSALNPTLRSWIGTIAAYSVVGVGAIAVLSKLATIGYSAYNGMSKFMQAIGGAQGAVIGLTAAAAAYVVWQTHQQAKETAKVENEMVGKSQGTDLTRSQLVKSEVYDEAKYRLETEGKKSASSYLDERYNEAVKRQNKLLDEANKLHPSQRPSALADWMFGEGKYNKKMKDAGEAGEEVKKAHAARMELLGGQKFVGAADKRKFGGLNVDERQQGMQGLLLSLSSMKGQVSYGGIEEAYKKIQVESLGKDPLTLELEKLNRIVAERLLVEAANQTIIQKDMARGIAQQYGLKFDETAPR